MQLAELAEHKHEHTITTPPPHPISCSTPCNAMQHIPLCISRKREPQYLYLLRATPAACVWLRSARRGGS